MARFISKALLRRATATASHCLSPNPYITIAYRHRSSQATKPQFIEMLSSEGDYEISLKLFDDVIQRILITKATPDWLPFLPGSSFWVPPRPSRSNLVDLVDKLTYELSDEESLSVATLRGWPCSEFFIQESESEGTIKVKILTISENVAHSEEEEG